MGMVFFTIHQMLNWFGQRTTRGQQRILMTSIPYNEKVRGLEIRIRCYEPASRAVIQLTVRESFN